MFPILFFYHVSLKATYLTMHSGIKIDFSAFKNGGREVDEQPHKTILYLYPTLKGGFHLYFLCRDLYVVWCLLSEALKKGDSCFKQKYIKLVTKGSL